jgi:DNA-binding NtrC family response regulator
VRELRNTVERSLLSAHGEWIDVADLPNAVLGAAVPAANAGAALEAPGERNLDDWLAEVERQAISQALAQTHGVQAHAARKLGISERSLWHRIKKLGIQISRVVR